MQYIMNHKMRLKNIALIIVFVLLTITITKGITNIYAVSSLKQFTCVPIVMYHQVKYDSYGKDVISPYEFESDLKFLVKNNYHTITMSDLIDYVYYDQELPENPIILTFDDGYLSTYRYVYPLLKEYNMKIVLSIVGKSVDDFSKVDDNNVNYAHITWSQVKEMIESGLVEIQNHSYNLHKTGCRYGCGQNSNEAIADYEKAISEDVLTFQSQMESMTGILPNTFTYPYGKYNDNTELILKNLGYRATLSCQYGVNLISKDPDKLFGLKRMCRAHNHSLNSLIKEGMETLKHLKDE